MLAQLSRECDSLGILRVSSSFYRHALVYFMAELGVIKFALSSLFPSLSPFHPSAVHSPPSSVSFPISVISSLGVMWSSSPPLSSSLPSHPPLSALSPSFKFQIPPTALLLKVQIPRLRTILYTCANVRYPMSQHTTTQQLSHPSTWTQKSMPFCLQRCMQLVRLSFFLT